MLSKNGWFTMSFASSAEEPSLVKGSLSKSYTHVFANSLTYFRDEVLQLGTHVDSVLFWVWEYNFASLNQNPESVVVFVHKGWSSSGHLVDQNTEGPPVDREAMTLHV